MEQIPLPSYIHYELLLQLLERQSAIAVGQQSQLRDQLNQLIITLRKAYSQQKHFEESCHRAGIDIEFHWSLNEKKANPTAESAPEPPSS
jgi:hypothetical protein